MGEDSGIPPIQGSSIKGEAAIDWSDRQARKALLAEIVADADRLLELAGAGGIALGQRRAAGDCMWAWRILALVGQRGPRL